MSNPQSATRAELRRLTVAFTGQMVDLAVRWIDIVGHGWLDSWIDEFHAAVVERRPYPPTHPGVDEDGD